MTRLKTRAIALQNVNMSDASNRLRAAREAAGYETAQEFAEKNNFAKSTYNTHETGARGMNAEVAEKYANLLKISPSWLLFGKEHIVVSVSSAGEVQPSDIDLDALNVTGSAQADAWHKNANWPTSEWKVEVCPKDPRFLEAELFCLLVAGDDMNKKYQKDDILRCLPIAQDPNELTPGKRYIVHRANDEGLIEVTAKELREQEDGSMWLWPLSHNPKHQTPLELSDKTVKIHARVVGYSSDE